MQEGIVEEAENRKPDPLVFAIRIKKHYALFFAGICCLILAVYMLRSQGHGDAKLLPTQ